MKKNDPLVTKSMLESTLDERFEKFGREVDDKAREYRDHVLNKLDDVIKELENNREERDFLKYDIKQLDERIAVLEK